jgi:hypothetical protein
MNNFKYQDKINIIKEANNKIFNSLLKDTEIFKNLIFVYTPPKVGSTSLVSSIRLSASHKYSIIHIHDEIMLNYITNINNVSINELIEYNKYIGKNVYVIDIYRTPIERKISEYFEKISPYHFNNSEENINNYNINKIITRFNNIFPYIGIGDHFYEKYNIDPETFDYTKKYIHQIINGIHYVKLRLNDSNKWGSILTEILNTEILMAKDYTTENKIIGQLYALFKKQYKLPSNYFEMIKNDKYLNLYFNEKERNEYLNIWNKKIDTVHTPYTEEQYNFYINLCLENQYLNDFQIDHYIDNGCLCKPCSSKRNEYFNKIKNGEQIKDKIIHNVVVNELITNKISKLNSAAKLLLVEKNKKIIKKMNKLSDNINLNYNFNNNNTTKINRINYL